MPFFTARILAAALALAGTAVAGPAPAAFAEPDARTLRQRLAAASARLEVVVEEYNAVRDDLASTRAEAAMLTARAEPLSEAIHSRQERVGTLAARSYRASGSVAATALLTAASPQEFAGRLLALDRLVSEQDQAIAALSQARHRHESARRSLDALAARQRGQQRRLAEQRRRIEAEIARLEALRGNAPAEPAPADAAGSVAPPYVAGRAGRVVRFGYAQLGKAYRWGAEGPDSYDCSGLTTAAWRRAGVELPHNAARQWRAVTPVSRPELRPGDLVFYYRGIHHVGIYVGGGKIVHAPNHGQRIRVEGMGYAPIHGFGRPG
ncbi:MAG TPA: NlpC/P60 family protein [Pilimelia sp.]|nr:NlpC/P60 family protein [Pilimelia sp.]